MGLPKAVSLACLYSAHFFFRAALMRRCACLPQHPAAWKLYLSCNIFAEEKCVTLSSVRYWDRKQRCARLFQVARKRTTVEMESPGEDRCRHVVFRETLDIRGRQQLRKAVPILRQRCARMPCATRPRITGVLRPTTAAASP